MESRMNSSYVCFSKEESDVTFPPLPSAEAPDVRGHAVGECA